MDASRGFAVLLGGLVTACGSVQVNTNLDANIDETEVVETEWQPSAVRSEEGGETARVVESMPAPVGQATALDKTAGLPIATLPGFRMYPDGRSRVFVEVSGDVSVTENPTEGILAYRLAGVRVPERVNRLPLLTWHFPTPVGRVRLVQVDTNADLIVELRARVSPKTKLKRSPFGTVLSLDFPKLSEATLAEMSAAPPRPAPAKTIVDKRADSHEPIDLDD